MKYIRMKLPYLILFLVILGCKQNPKFNFQTHSIDKSRLDLFFNSLELTDNRMLSISVYSNGNEVYKRSIGFSDVSKGVRPNELTKYRIGSISKTFTATIIMQLIDELKLSLDTPLNKFFPQIVNSEKITVELLLRHHSGLFDITRDKDINSWIFKTQTREQMLDRFIKNSSVFEPDERTEYSSTNYLLLTYIAEEIENKSYAQILESRIIEPLELKRTEYGKKINTDDNEALSYSKEWYDWELEPETNMSAPSGAGALVSTPSEVNIFINSLFSRKLVSNASFYKMIDFRKKTGMGLFKYSFRHVGGIGHGGNIDGFRSIVVYFPKEKFSVTILSNGLTTSITSLLSLFLDELREALIENA